MASRMLTKERICLTISFGRLPKEHLSVAQGMFGVYTYEMVMVAFLVKDCSVETALFQVETIPSQARPVPDSPFSNKRSKGRWHMERPKSPANSAGRGCGESLRAAHRRATASGAPAAICRGAWQGTDLVTTVQYCISSCETCVKPGAGLEG